MMRTVVLALIGMVFGIGCGSPDGGGSSNAVPVPKAGQADSETGEHFSFDPKVEAAIRRDIRKPEGSLSKEDLAKITRLRIWNNRLSKIPAGLEKLPNLTELNLSNNKLTNVAGLEKLTNLKILLI